MNENNKYQDVKKLISSLKEQREKLASEGGDTRAEQEELSEEIQLLQNDLVMASILEDDWATEFDSSS